MIGSTAKVRLIDVLRSKRRMSFIWPWSVLRGWNGTLQMEPVSFPRGKSQFIIGKKCRERCSTVRLIVKISVSTGILYHRVSVIVFSNSSRELVSLIGVKFHVDNHGDLGSE